MPENRKISIVAPCYNEEAVLPELFQRLGAVAAGWGMEYEIICVDDGSRDRTWELLKQQHDADPHWCSLSFARNFGHQVAISAGLYHASGDAVVVMDADLQDPPEQIARLIEKWREGYDVVFAIRQKRKENFLKRFCYWAFYRLMSQLVSFEIPLDTGDFCLMDRRIVKWLNAMPERNRFVRGLRAWSGFRQTGLVYERDARAAGNAKYDFFKLLKLARDGIFSFSTVPLTLMAQVGMWISFFSFLGILWTLSTKMFSGFFSRHGFPPVQGFTTIVIVILFLGGIQMMSLGILGEYIGRIYEEVKRRPLWIIQDNAGIEPKIPDLPENPAKAGSGGQL